MKKYLIFLSFVLFLLKSDSLFASHLVGGDITVKQSGTSNTYTVTVTLFRDKTSSTGFGSTISVGVFNKSTDAFYKSISLSDPAITDLVLGDACYTPSLQIEKAVFIQTTTIADNSNGYYLSYLRCCRNGSIVNITSPSSTGWLAYCEIPDPGIASGNSSPVFSANPSGYMCRNYLNNVSGFQATDADGDNLVYKFSAPLSCSSSGQCSSTSSSPGASASTAGPYGAVTWVSGYSTSNPMGDASMAIASSTGVISCTPPNAGVYVFGVTVEEWRSGVKLGEIRRDFQFDVLSGCSVLNVTVGPSNTVCQGTPSTLAAIGASSSFTYAWNPGSETTSAITVTPASPGTYNYTVTTTNGGCVSVTTTALVVNSLPTPSISTSGNICLGQNQTLTASGGSAYNWSNGTVTAAMSAATAGTYTVWVTDASNCTASPITGTISAPIAASTYTWTGAGSNTSNDWFDAVNWSVGNGCLPTCAKNVVIPNVANYPSISTASGVAACGSITLNSGAQLAFSGAAAELDICGDFVNNGGTLTASTGVIKFMGSTAQNYTSTSAGDLNNVILANTATFPLLTVKEGVGYTDLSLDNDGVFTFESGILKTEGNRALVIKNTATGAITGHGTNKYVYGRISRSVVNTTSYDFPVGGNPSGATVYPYELMNIEFTSITGLSSLTACFDNPGNTTGNETGNGLPIAEQTGNHTELINTGGTNTTVGSSQAGIWTVIPNAGTGTYHMTLYGRNFDNSAGAGSYYSVMKRSTYSMCGSIPVWTLDGSVSTNSLVSNVITATRRDMSGFSQFAIAKHSTPLPVDLLEFSGKCHYSSAILKWSTANELNNNFFTIDKSTDAKLYSFIATIPGAGNSSSIKHYSFQNEEALKGTIYYRLSQTDYNGTKKTFAPIAVSCEQENNLNVTVNPNPVTEGSINLSIAGEENKNILLVLTDVLGKEIYTKVIVTPSGNFLIKINPDQELARGVYFITASSKDEYISKKIVME